MGNMGRAATLLLIGLCLFVSVLADAATTASGRALQSGHWLTCWGGSDVALRRDPPFHRNSPEETVAAYVPTFQGSYSFEVKDTWQEWVTHYGSSCFHCGESCSGSGQSRSCSCDTCSWQELETFYRPWSVQNVAWKAKFIQDANYRKKRTDWIKQGRPEVSRETDDLQNLLEFDPERPLEYFLFPGEVEKLELRNKAGWSGGKTVLPTLEIEDARHEYEVRSMINGQSSEVQCDDRDLVMESTIKTKKRLVTDSPNSIEFRKGWARGATNAAGQFTEEPGFFEFVDMGAQRYEGQNIFDHYKDSRIAVRLKEIDRAWWFDRFVSARNEITDNHSILMRPNEVDRSEPMEGVYQVYASELLVTPFLKTPFHLNPGKQYEVCTWVRRQNNIYYRKTKYLFFEAWSEPNCALFSYNPADGYDLRSTGRKVRDVITRLTLLPLW